MRTKAYCLILAGLVGCAAAQQPSLAEQVRQQHQGQGTKARRVLTNEDLPHDPTESKPVAAQAASPGSQPTADAGTGANMLRQNLENERYLTERITTFEKLLKTASDADRDRINAGLKNYQRALEANKLERTFLEQRVAGKSSTETQGHREKSE